MKFTNEDVREILQLLDATKYDELLLETERFKLTLRRNRDSGNWTQETQVLSAPNIVKASAGAPVAVHAGTTPTADLAQPGDSRKAGWLEVRAHLPGTFYRSPKPGAPPFVEIGTHVEEETVVGIIETMKLMNAVHAQTSGEIVEICFENAQFTERDAVLMRIKAGSE
jgi:acetyl-CoA carboxylase biotin carboxyl carrier protein